MSDHEINVGEGDLLGPYRTLADVDDEPKPPIVFEDATLEEIQFWERVYIGICNTECCEQDTVLEWANEALLDRRKTFPAAPRAIQVGFTP